MNGVEDILEELLPQLSAAPTGVAAQDHAGKPRGMALLPEERDVYERLSAEPQHIDKLTAALRMPPAKTAGMLLQLELKGAVRQLAGNMFVRVESSW